MTILSPFLASHLAIIWAGHLSRGTHMGFQASPVAGLIPSVCTRNPVSSISPTALGVLRWFMRWRQDGSPEVKGEGKRFSLPSLERTYLRA